MIIVIELPYDWSPDKRSKGYIVPNQRRSSLQGLPTFICLNLPLPCSQVIKKSVRLHVVAWQALAAAKEIAKLVKIDMFSSGNFKLVVWLMPTKHSLKANLQLRRLTVVYHDSWYKQPASTVKGATRKMPGFCGYTPLPWLLLQYFSRITIRKWLP